jgi:glutathione S-transferase
MKLYDLRTGTNTRRVRIFLAEKGVKLPTVEVDMMKGETMPQADGSAGRKPRSASAQRGTEGRT